MVEQDQTENESQVLLHVTKQTFLGISIRSGIVMFTLKGSQLTAPGCI